MSWMFQLCRLHKTSILNGSNWLYLSQHVLQSQWMFGLLFERFASNSATLFRRCDVKAERQKRSRGDWLIFKTHQSRVEEDEGRFLFFAFTFTDADFKAAAVLCPSSLKIHVKRVNAKRVASHQRWSNCEGERRDTKMAWRGERQVHHGVLLPTPGRAAVVWTLIWLIIWLHPNTTHIFLDSVWLALPEDVIIFNNHP